VIELADDASRGQRTMAGTQRIGIGASGAPTLGARIQNCVCLEGRDGIRLKTANAGGNVRNGGTSDVVRKQKARTRGGVVR
jgi:hypothetical protein